MPVLAMASPIDSTSFLRLHLLILLPVPLAELVFQLETSRSQVASRPRGRL